MHDGYDNLIVCGFNCIEWNVYKILSYLSFNIHHSFQLHKKISANVLDTHESLIDAYAVFKSDLDYFNSKVYLIKNFIWKDKQGYSIFDDAYEPMYFIRTKPQKMYILMIYSDEIKNINNIHQFIKYNTLPIQQLSVLHSAKLYTRLNHFVNTE